MLRLTKQLIKKTFNVFGLEVVKISNSSIHNFLGLRNLPIRTIIDGGANTGQFARMISKAFPEANIYSFEPLPTAFKELSKWAKSRNKKVKVFNFALGDREGDMDILYHCDHSPSSSLLKTTETCKTLYPFTRKQENVSVKITALDRIVANLPEPVSPEIFIKLDVQGYEAHAIKGGVETFRKAKACLLEISLDGLYENQATFKDIVIILSGLGFQYAGNLQQFYGDDGHVIFLDALFIKGP